MKVTLLTGRTLRQGQGKEQGKLSERYWQSVTICQIDPDDMKLLGIRENENVKISTENGSVVLRAVKSVRAPHRGAIFVPYGPWASLVMNSTTHGTGMPSLKGITVEVNPAPTEVVLSLPELLKRHFRKE
ncbi:MAG: molybdopterin dinucleotide-binding protein [Candidatus Bathyarchaeota archaeon]|nr:molybdopterin dinucleotide-binding protein [Candidatus Bathyarchaeota archaeon]UCC28295.1 MAG: molybdopterin dinucleotide-binding protein [Candidatus Bathyarchaeota archaeon]